MTPLTDRIVTLLALGPLNGVEVAERLGVKPREAQNCLSNLKLFGRIIGKQDYGNCHGSGPIIYSLPVPILIPHISAGEYRGWMPSGTRPETIVRAAA